MDILHQFFESLLTSTFSISFGSAFGIVFGAVTGLAYAVIVIVAIVMIVLVGEAVTLAPKYATKLIILDRPWAVFCWEKSAIFSHLETQLGRNCRFFPLIWTVIF